MDIEQEILAIYPTGITKINAFGKVLEGYSRRKSAQEVMLKDKIRPEVRFLGALTAKEL